MSEEGQFKAIEIKTLEEYTCLVRNLEMKLYFRGESKIHNYILPSLFHSASYFDKEDYLFKKFLEKDPELFVNSNSNFDSLALMQHHQLPTRLLDITKNPLVALYFATENSEVDGQVIIFSDHPNKASLKKSLENELLFGLYKELYKNTRYMNCSKTCFSDEIEIYASLARLNEIDRKKVINNLRHFFKEVSSIAISDTHIWSKTYLANISGGKISSELMQRLANLYDEFNNHDVHTQRLYHEIRSDLYSFEPVIDPLGLYLPKIVSTRIIDKRIRNQQGLFMMVPFVSKKSAKVNGKFDFNKYCRLINDRINILGVTCKDSSGEDSKTLRIKIPKYAKKNLRDELSLLGIKKSFIYPDDPSNVAEEIVNSLNNDN